MQSKPEPVTPDAVSTEVRLLVLSTRRLEETMARLLDMLADEDAGRNSAKRNTHA